jgi:DNA repair protein RAD5
MGLGKTIEVLSLIHAVKYPELDPDQINLVDSDDDIKPSTSKSIISSSTREKYPVIKTTLIVCPMSLLSQWRDEVNNVSAEDTLSVEVYYGKKKDWNLKSIRARKAKLPDVLVTTYGVLVSEYNDEEKKPTTAPLFNGKN